MSRAKVSTMEDVAEFRRLFSYSDGKLFWKVSPCNRVKVGNEAGSENSNGYVVIKIRGVFRKAHRIIWEMHKGPIPQGMEIDHENQIRNDNRIENLRLVSSKGNKKNTTRRCDNSSGVTGVYWFKRECKWKVQIKVDGKQSHLGLFDNLDDAVTARKSAERQHGFHENHGNEKVVGYGVSS